MQTPSFTSLKFSTMAGSHSPEYGGSPSFTSILAYLSAYFLVELIIKKAFKSVNPQFYAKLLQGSKDAQYFAFCMGIVITLFTTPFCVAAFNTSSSDGPFENSDISAAGQVCIASRSVLWVSELNRLNHSWAYIGHHLSSLGVLVYHLKTRLPLQIMYGFYSSLATELFSDTRCLLDLHGVKPATSSLAYWVQVTNTMLIVILRLPPIIYTATFFPSWPITGSVFWINAACLLFYALFIVNLILVGAKKLEMFKLVSTRPAYIHVCQTLEVSIYSIFFAVASFFVAMMTSTIYLHFAQTSGTSYERFRLTIQILLTGLAGLIGARIPSIYKCQEASFVLSSRIFAKSQLWLQGNLTAMAVSVLVSPWVDRYCLLLAMCLSLPFGEAIGRLGCHFAGCCGRNDKNFSTQAKASLLNAILGLVAMSLLITRYLTFQQAAGLSLACNSMIRLVLRPNTFATAQLAGAVVYFAQNWNSDGNMKRGQMHFENRLFVGVKHLSAASVGGLAAAAIAAGVFVQLCGGMDVKADPQKAGFRDE